jgi:hypothetical protein
VYDFVCIVLIYLLYVTKDFAKKMNPTMVEPLAAPLTTWLLRLRPNPRRPMFAMGLVKGAVEGFHINL